MHNNTSIGLAQRLLCKGVHLREIQRFLEAGKVDPNADTIPAPPPDSPLQDGSQDPDTADTIRPPATELPIDARADQSTVQLTEAELLDFRGTPDGYWDDVAAAVECLAG